MASLYKELLAQTDTQITALSLTGITSNVVSLKNASIGAKHVSSLPVCLLSPFGQPAMISGGPGDTIGANAIEYPVAVLLVQAGNRNQSSNLDRMAQWLEDIVMEFHHKALTSGITAGKRAYSCVVSPKDTFQQSAWLDNLDVGGLVLRFQCQINR